MRRRTLRVGAGSTHTHTWRPSASAGWLGGGRRLMLRRGGGACEWWMGPPRQVCSGGPQQQAGSGSASGASLGRWLAWASHGVGEGRRLQHGTGGSQLPPEAHKWCMQRMMMMRTHAGRQAGRSSPPARPQPPGTASQPACTNGSRSAALPLLAISRLIVGSAARERADSDGVIPTPPGAPEDDTDGLSPTLAAGPRTPEADVVREGGQPAPAAAPPGGAVAAAVPSSCSVDWRMARSRSSNCCWMAWTWRQAKAGRGRGRSGQRAHRAAGTLRFATAR